MRKHLEKVSDFGLGPPTIGWLDEALKETRELAATPHPEQPVLYLLGSEEEIVSPDAIRSAAARGGKAQLVEIDGAKHEVFMETADRRAQAWSAIDGFLEAQGV